MRIYSEIALSKNLFNIGDKVICKKAFTTAYKYNLYRNSIYTISEFDHNDPYYISFLESPEYYYDSRMFKPVKNEN